MAACGKRRLHSKPDAREIGACMPWLDQEIELVRPQILVALGATSARAILGEQFRVTRQRGELFPSGRGHLVTATVHPSSILRAPSDDERRLAMREFVADLQRVTRALEEGGLRRAG